MPKRPTLVVLLILFAIVTLIVSCQKTTPPAEKGASAQRTPKKGPVLARINNEVITVGEFKDEIASLPEYTRRKLKKDEQKRKRLENMVKEELLRQEAEKRGIGEDKEIQRKVERYRNRLI